MGKTVFELRLVTKSNGTLYINKPALGEETGGENRGIFGDFIRGGAREALFPHGPGGGYYPNGGGGGHYPNAGSGGHNPGAAGSGAHNPSAGGGNYQYGETETEKQNYEDYSAINNIESDGNKSNLFNPYISKPSEETEGENRGLVGDIITGGIKAVLFPHGPRGGYYPNGGGGGVHYPNAGGLNYQYGETETEQKNYLDYSVIIIIIIIGLLSQ